MANNTDYLNYHYNTSILTDAINAENPFLGIWNATNTYTDFYTQYVIVAIILIVMIIVFRFYQVNYLKNITISVFLTTLLIALMVVMGVMQVHLFVVGAILSTILGVYYKYSGN